MNKFQKYAFSVILAMVLPLSSVHATPIDVSTPKYAVPPNITTSSNRPMLMLATSKDHTLFGPIYTDFEDLEGDGKINTTFQPTFKYYGYFDSAKCYVYQNSRFEPSALATVGSPAATETNGGSISTSAGVSTFTDTSHGSGIFTTGMALSGNGVLSNTYITDYGTGTGANSGGTYIVNNDYTDAPITSQTIGGAGSKYTCGGSGQWSGNFLNWATMTRMDVVRKLLYGGKRSTDTSSLTVLERANLSKDSHSFTKHYYGTDIRDFTPFTVANLTKSNTYVGLTICNRSDSMGEGGIPVIRIAKGNYRMWSTVEGTVCEWGTTSNNFGTKLRVYYIDSDKGAGVIAHEALVPVQATDGATYGGIGPELTVRVKVCDATMLGEERCQAFPPSSTTNYKPYGLFQEFGYSQAGGPARAEFGVITGSYDNNLTAGALRKNMGDFADEINSTTGVFCHAVSSGCAANIADGRVTGTGAIKAIDAFLLYGRGSSNYDGSSVQLPGEMADGILSAWGNPIGEMLVQSLQYYAGLSSTNPSSATKDSNKGLPVQTWVNPLSDSNTTRTGLYGNASCRPMYILALSSSALSFDGQGASAFSTLPNRISGSLDAYTNLIGDAEGLSGSDNRSVGSVSGGFGETCSGKSIGTLANVSGVCPDAPSIGGTYHISGAALYANTSKIKTLTCPPADLAKVQDALKVKTLAASLSGGAARIDVLIPGSNPKKYVYITPESLWASNSNSKKMAGAMLTFNSINDKTYTTTTANAIVHTGTFVVTWNDSQFGGDYDMDIAGFIRYDVLNPSATGQPYRIKVTTDILNVGAGWTGSHGFSIIGVTKTTDDSNANGRYLTHRHLTSDSVLSGADGYLCSSDGYRKLISTSAKFNGIHTTPVDTKFHCDTSSDWKTIRTSISKIESWFNMVGAENVIVKDPLWYAAKYGSFASSTKNSDGTFTEVAMPTVTASWDKFSADGSQVSDGNPDGYYLARRPDLLEAQLRKALDDLAKNANAAPAVSSSQLITDGFKYVATLDSTAVEGNVEAYKVDGGGSFKSTYDWRAGHLLRTFANSDKGNSRSIITNYGNSGGYAFRWASLPSGYKTEMTTASTNKLTTTNASLVVDYLRGDQSLEAASIGLRVRGDNILGPVVNATPWIQDRPTANYTESSFPGYRSFMTEHTFTHKRDKLLWVAANDGMLHAFNPTTGAEVFAYVPGPLANRLAEIPLQRGTAGRTRLNNANFTLDTTETLPEGTVWPYVDGNPYTGDVKVGATPTWKTYLFSSLGRGGKGLFALDVTSVSGLSSAESNASSIFKWQFTSDDDTDLGYIVNDVTPHIASGQATPIVKLNNGKFALLLGNGQKSSTGKAVLFMLFMDGPTSGSWSGQYAKIVADAGVANGLSTPTWVDLDNNGTADVVYAGDLQGNLWKFDISSATASNWAVAYKSGTTNKPLFTAKDGSSTLAITTAPEITYPPFDGLIVNFATGNAFESGNYPNYSVNQRIYGIWDRPAFALTSGGRDLPPDNLSTLVSRTYSRQNDGNVILTGTATTIDWVTKDGWYFNLPGSSEMVLSDPKMRAGVLVLTSVRPKAVATGTCGFCSTAPEVTLYTIDPISGKTEKNSQGWVEIDSSKVLITGTPILDQKVRIVNDRTTRPFTTACVKGTPNCTCVTVGGVEKCTKDEETCTKGTPGCVCKIVDGVEECKKGTTPQCTSLCAMRVVGPGADVTLCYNCNARVQWREIPGLRTDQ